MEKLQITTPIAILAGSVLMTSAIAISWAKDTKQKACTALSHSAEVLYGKSAYPIVLMHREGRLDSPNKQYITVMEDVHGVTFEECITR
jgi:hypothetical protein